MADENKEVYNVNKVHIFINEADGDRFELTGIAEDGFGITPTSETEVIAGLKGEQGFSVDPSDGAEGSITLKSTSDKTNKMIDLYNKQQRGEIAPFAIEVEVDSDVQYGTNPQKAFGFSAMSVDNAYLVSYAPFETDNRSAPDYEFEFVGFGFSVSKPTSNQ